MRVLLDEGEVKCVPLTPETTARDVIECCRDPDEPFCTLTQTTRDGGEFLIKHMSIEHLRMTRRWIDMNSNFELHSPHSELTAATGRRQSSPLTRLLMASQTVLIRSLMTSQTPGSVSYNVTGRMRGRSLRTSQALLSRPLMHNAVG